MLCKAPGAGLGASAHGCWQWCGCRPPTLTTVCKNWAVPTWGRMWERMESCKSTAGTSVHPTKNRRAWPQQVTNSIVHTVLVCGVLPVGQGSSLETAAVGHWCLCSIHYCNCPFITFIKEKNKEKKRKVSDPQPGCSSSPPYSAPQNNACVHQCQFGKDFEVDRKKFSSVVAIKTAASSRSMLQCSCNPGILSGKCSNL